MIQSTKELDITAINVTRAAQIVKILAHIIVLRQPMTSNNAPVIILPIPLQTESTPTKETAKVSGAFTESAISFAKLITELPTAARKDMHRNAIQKDGRQSI